MKENEYPKDRFNTKIPHVRVDAIRSKLPLRDVNKEFDAMLEGKSIRCKLSFR